MSITDFSLDYFSLSGKNALITGGNTGLGQAFTLALAGAGANVFVVSVIPDDGSTADLVRPSGSRYAFHEADITAPDAPRSIVDACVEEFGSIDILVNSAGVCNVAPVREFTRAKWDPMIDVNLTAPFELGREASRYMSEQLSGKIINVASVFSFLGGGWSPAYAATKHGIVGFTKAYCEELAADNIQVNAIAPGYFATEMTAGTRADGEASRRVLDHIPAHRWGEAADLMGATVFLASRASDYVNGHVLTVDGGYLIR